MKNTVLLTILLTTTLNAQTSWRLVEDTFIRGSISGTIEQGYVFKTGTKDYFVLSEKTKQKVKTKNPDVKIFHNGNRYKLVIEDFDEPVFCKKIESIIETQISGEFKGWQGSTVFKMMNGQIWKQSSYEYHYHYAYSPEVLIYEFEGTWKMKVDEVDEVIAVIRIK